MKKELSATSPNLYPSFTCSFPPFSLCDAHTHIDGENELLERGRLQITSLICACTPPEALRLRELVNQPTFSSVLIPTYGLHPWQAGKYNVSDMEPFVSECDVIGEIGMDNVWCDVPLDIQERVFRRQLFLAERLQKPVILHTKGQEKQIADIIKEYHNTYLVHWYSSMEHLEGYKDLDCYFSIGPDIWWNKAVHQVASTVSLERILVETDGMNAVRWAYDREEIQKEMIPPVFPPLPASVSDALISTIEVMAEIKGMTPEVMRKQVCANFNRFVKIFTP